MRTAGLLGLLARVGALGALALPTVHARTAVAETLRVHYAVTLIGLPIGTAGLTGVFAPTSYHLDLIAKLTGLAGMLSSSRGAATAAGALAGSKLLPASFATTSSNADSSRTVRMVLQSGTVKGVEITPPVDPTPDRIPLSESDTHGILDPLSALVMPVPGNEAVIGPSACNRTLPVFDGYARFAINLAYEGQRTVQTKGYAGPVAVCSARYTPISGHRRDRKGTQFMADNRDMEAWLAPVGATRLLVPFRISVKTMIGTTVIEATEFSADESGKRADGKP